MTKIVVVHQHIRLNTQVNFYNTSNEMINLLKTEFVDTNKLSSNSTISDDALTRNTTLIFSSIDSYIEYLSRSETISENANRLIYNTQYNILSNTSISYGID